MEHANSHRHRGASVDGAADDRRARILSRVERETHSPAIARARRLHEGTIHARAVVCRRRHEHLRGLHARTHRLYGRRISFTRISRRKSATLESRPAHHGRASEESSLDAWLEKYDDYNLPERSISYYNKGQILGVLLDLAIRDATDNHKSLDDVMRRMNDEYAKQGKFYDDSEGIRAVVEEVSGKEL